MSSLSLVHPFSLAMLNRLSQACFKFCFVVLVLCDNYQTFSFMSCAFQKTAFSPRLDCICSKATSEVFLTKGPKLGSEWLHQPFVSRVWANAPVWSRSPLDGAKKQFCAELHDDGECTLGPPLEYESDDANALGSLTAGRGV